MNVSDIYGLIDKPTLYTPGTGFMWTDAYIGKQLLAIHLDPNVDLASRKASTIDDTVEWILSRKDGGCLDILDLGCGPGLYTERMAAKGHRVTGVDISRISIEAARQRSGERGFPIEYINRDYITIDLQEGAYDVIMMIYADFGVLLPPARMKLLSGVRKALKPGGIFVFDVINDRDITGNLMPPAWECTKGGFWRETPYIALSSSYYYEEEKVILSRHIVLDDRNGIETYHFWNHLFSHDDLEELLKAAGFARFSFHEDVLPAGGAGGGNNITFCVAGT